MPQIGRFQGTNVLAFPELDIDFSQKGLSLIIGRNLDDIKGNDSRNGVGKSSLFKALEGHIFPGVSGLKASELVTDTVNKNYLTVCEWQPSNGETYHSYQYYKHVDWGNGSNVYRGGTYEQHDAGEAGVVDVSYDDSRDASRSIAEFMNLTYDEWTLLTSLIDVGNDDIHPFFCSNRTGRLELVQNLYGLNYSQINYQNKEETKVIRKEADRLGVSIQSSLKVLDDQLVALPVKEELELTAAVQGKAVAKLEKQLNTASSQLDRIKEMRSTWERYNELNTKLTTAGLALRQVDAELDGARAQVEALQSGLDSAGLKRTALSLYLDKLQQVTDLNQQLAASLNGASTDDLEGQRGKAQALSESLRQVLNYISSSNSDFAKVKDRLSPIDQPSIALPLLLTQLQAEAAALPSIEDASAEVTRIHLQYKEAETQVARAAALQALLDTLTQVGYLEYADYFTDHSHLFNLTLQIKTALAGYPNAIAELERELLAVTSALSGTTVCPTCDQQWCSHTEAELADFAARLPVIERGLQTLRADQAKATSDLQALEYLVSLLPGATGEVYWQYRAGTFVPAEYDLNAINAQLGEASRVYADITKKHSAVVELIQALERILATVPAEFLDYLENNYQHYSDQLQAATTQLANLQSIKVIDTQLKQVQAALALAKESEHVAASPEPAAELIQITEYIATTAASLAQNQAFIRGMSPYLAEWLEFKSERFANIQQLAQTMATQDEAGLTQTHTSLTAKITEARNLFNVASNQLTQRLDLERRRVGIQEKAIEVNALESKLRVQKAIDLLSGPRGLMVSRTESLFQRINLLLNQYLNVLIQDGISKGRPLSAWLEMSNQSVDLNIYRGQTFKSKKSISASEKARIKLALTLAMREVAPKNKLTNILLLDEIDGSSCETNSSRIWDCIQMYLERNPDTAIWAVSHSTSVQQSGVWDRVYEIVKNDGHATITLLD